jgi:hypothetical protein
VNQFNQSNTGALLSPGTPLVEPGQNNVTVRLNSTGGQGTTDTETNISFDVTGLPADNVNGDFSGDAVAYIDEGADGTVNTQDSIET